MTRISIRTTVVTGFAILTVASLGLLAIDAHTEVVTHMAKQIGVSPAALGGYRARG